MNRSSNSTKSAAEQPVSAKSGMKLAKAFMRDPSYIQGRREFAKWRDLGVKSATDGKMRANHVIMIANKLESTGWHYHTCEFQFVYVLKGHTVIEFEDGTITTCRAGDSLFIPGGVRHNEVSGSDGHEVIEFTMPGEIETVNCARPEDLPDTLIPVGNE